MPNLETNMYVKPAQVKIYETYRDVSSNILQQRKKFRF